MKKVSLLVFLPILALSGDPRPASADPINITSGYLEMHPTFGPMVLVGDRGFTFSAGVDIVGGFFQPDECNFDPLRCTPGATLGPSGP